MRLATLVLTMWVAPLTSAAAQDSETQRAAYFRAVADFFSLPSSEIVILGDWELPPDEIPVVLFIARRAGVSPEALVALRSGGQDWTTLSARYRVTAATLHLPIRDDAPAGALSALYDVFRRTPADEWPEIDLTSVDIISLVNVRVIAQSLGLSVEEVVRGAGSSSSFVQLHAQLKR